jgi:hypothetical protein
LESEVEEIEDDDEDEHDDDLAVGVAGEGLVREAKAGCYSTAGQEASAESR